MPKSHLILVFIYLTCYGYNDHVSFNLTILYSYKLKHFYTTEKQTNKKQNRSYLVLTDNQSVESLRTVSPVCKRRWISWMDELVEFTSPDDRRASFNKQRISSCSYCSSVAQRKPRPLGVPIGWKRRQSSPAVTTAAASGGKCHAPSAFSLGERDANNLRLFTTTSSAAAYFRDLHPPLSSFNGCKRRHYFYYVIHLTENSSDI